MIDEPDETLSIQQAIAYLTEITESEKLPLDKIAVEQQPSFSMNRSQKYALHRVKAILSTIHNYLKRVYRQEKKNIEDPSVQQSLQAIMILLQEAVDKMERNFPETERILGKKRISTLPQYKKLQQFYVQKILSKPIEENEIEKIWPSNWTDTDLEKQGIRDIRQVKEDLDYELFYLRRLDNTPYFSKDLIRHLKMITDFEGILQVIEGDPFVRFTVVQDKNCQVCAEQVKEYLIAHFPKFFREMLKNKHFSFTEMINKALIALFLSSNPSNVIYETVAFHCLKYFQDFLLYLKEIFVRNEYSSGLSMENVHEFLMIQIQMVHAICFAIFTHHPQRVHVIQHLKALLGEPEKGKYTALQFIKHLQENYLQLTRILNQYPSGPLFKMIDVINERSITFCPIQYNNLPCRLFITRYDHRSTVVLRIPNPTLQTTLEEAHILDEFKGFLRSLCDKKPLRLVVINLQSRLSRKEMARAKALEELQKEGEFISSLLVITFSKTLGAVLYAASKGNWEVFHQELLEVLKKPEEFGLYFPPMFQEKKWSLFFTQIIPSLLRLFFSKKKNGNEQDCFDFMELFYFCVSLKILEIEKPQFFSYVCKDGVDDSTAKNFTLYMGTKILQGSFSASKKEEEYLKWLLFTPALMIRERAIQSSCFTTSCSSLQLLARAIEKNKAAVLKEWMPLFETDFFSTLDSEH